MSEPKRKIDSMVLRRVFELSARRLLILASEGEDELLAMVHRKAEESQGKESDKLVVTFSHTIKVDFTKNTQKDTLGGTMKVALVMEGDTDDPDQMSLFGEEEEEG